MEGEQSPAVSITEQILDVVRDYEEAVAAEAELSVGDPEFLVKWKQSVNRRVTIAATARPLVELLIRDTVEDARNADITWREVGDALGVTTQAAHFRYGRGSRTLSADDSTRS